MLQRHRGGAKQPLHCSVLRQTTSLVVAYSSRKFIIKSCYSTLTPSPTENSAPRGIARRVYPAKQVRWGESRKIFHKPWQGENRGAGQGAIDIISATSTVPSSKRFFSYSTTAYPNQTLCRRVGASFPFDKNTAVSRLGPNVLRRNNVSSPYGRQAMARRVHAINNRGLVDGFRRLEAQMNKIRSKENLNMAFECFEVLEKAIGDIVRSENGATPASLSNVKESEDEIQEDTTDTTDETQPSMAFPLQSRLTNFEDLELTPEPDLPYIPLTTYQIPEEVLERKQLLEDGSTNKNWSYSLYLNSSNESPRVHYCITPEQAENTAGLFLNDKVVGFDIEWDPWAKVENASPRSQVSLIQIAKQSDIALFHLAIFNCDEKYLLPKGLQKIIVSENILKVGVNISGDAQRIYKYLKIIPQGLFELSDLQNLLDTAERGGGPIPRRLVSLSNMTSENLLLPLRKGSVRLSNWKRPLTEQQKGYAASDAYAGLRLFDALEGKRHELRPFPPLPPYRKMQCTVGTVKKTKMVVERAAGVSKKQLSTVDEAIEGESNESSVKEKKLYKNPEIEQADNWVSEYVSKKGLLLNASAPQLRAYAMWYERGYDLEEISRLWRDPPLKPQTVAVYILEAIRLEKLPYDKEKVMSVIDHAGLMAYPHWRRLGPRITRNL